MQGLENKKVERAVNKYVSITFETEFRMRNGEMWEGVEIIHNLADVYQYISHYLSSLLYKV